MSKTRKADFAPEKITSRLTTEVESVFHSISYIKLKQGPVTNLLLKANSKRQVQVDNVTGDATITQGNLTILIKKSSLILRKLNFTTHRLFIALMIKATEKGSNSTSIYLPIKEYMEWCNKKQQRAMEKQVVQDLETLLSLNLSLKNPGGSTIFHGVNLCQEAYLKQGIIYINFTEKFHKVLERYSTMPYSREILKISHNSNPHSLYFYGCLAQNKFMNVAKPNADIISVKVLWESSPELPQYEEAKKYFGQLVTKPFERDMDNLVELGVGISRWEFCLEKGAPLTEYHLSNIHLYKVFSILFVKVTWLCYPDQTCRIERKDNFKKIALEKQVTKNNKKKPAKSK